jgi:phytoene dehydrogenase-like protein
VSGAGTNGVSAVNGSAGHGAIVVGGGHNGLVAAFYLAQAGLRPLVLERRDIVGGACVTEEFAPGFHASSGAYVLSMLRSTVRADMRLDQRGLEVDAAGPSLHLFDDGEHLIVHEDPEALATEVSRFSAHDAEQIPRFEENLARVAELIMPFIDMAPPDLLSKRPADLLRTARFGLQGARHRGEVDDALWTFATSARQYLDEWFEDDHVKAAFGWHAINDSLAGPSTSGTAYVLLHDHAGEDPSAGVRAWGFVRGGIGRVTELMAEAAIEAGATIRTEAEVEEILVSGGKVRGVRLTDGEELLAPLVLSNADPKRTFLKLLDESAVGADVAARIRGYRSDGSCLKITLGVSALPRVATVGDKPGVVGDHHRGIMEITGSLTELDRAQAEARAGQSGRDPHIELCIPTVLDPSLAPPGHHVVTIDVCSQPYELAEGWDSAKERVADEAIERIGRHLPELKGTIVHREVLSPLDFERRFNMTGGHPLHGEMGFDQLFSLRPTRGYADYRTPVENLYLCGAGTHPGGGVTGANGRNAAQQVLRDHPAPGGRLAALRARVSR